MPDVNVTQNQVNVTPDTSTLSITTSPVEVSVQQPATPSVTVDTSNINVDVTQPTAEVVIALAPGPQGPQGVPGSGGGVTSYSELSDIPSGIISGAAQLPAGLISSSLQDLGNITGSNILASGDVKVEGTIKTKLDGGSF